MSIATALLLGAALLVPGTSGAAAADTLPTSATPSDSSSSSSPLAMGSGVEVSSPPRPPMPSARAGAGSRMEAPRAPQPPPMPSFVAHPHADAPQLPPVPAFMVHPHADAPRPPQPPAAPRFAWSMSMDGMGPRLGTQVSTMTPELRAFFGAPRDAGLLVQGIEPGSAAEGAKLKVGDVLVEVDGQRIERITDVRRVLAGHKEGDVVEIEVVRKKKRKTFEATIDSSGSSLSFSLPPGTDFDRWIPPEARRHLGPEVREQVQRQLDQAREQLRQVERMLESLDASGEAGSPEESKSKSKAKSKAKKKSKSKSKAKKKAKPAKIDRSA